MADTKPFLQSDVEAAVRDNICRSVEALLGVEVVDIRFYREYGSDTIEVFVWQKGGISLNDCERISGAVSDGLDALNDAFERGYNLKVSSMGLDWPIKTEDDFRRALGEELEVVDASKKKHIGQLKAYDSQNIVLCNKGKDETINLNNITKVQRYIRF